MTDRIDLFLHIGAGKCGSSAIQRFLADNVAGLADDGFLVPGRDLTVDPVRCHQHLAYFESGIQRPGFVDEVTAALTELHAAAIRRGHRAVLVSAENLINPLGFVDLFLQVGDLFVPRIVAYVRRQDDFFISAWQQWQIKQHDDFWEYYNRHRGQVDWYRQLERWRQNYGRENMIVRRYSSRTLVDGDVVADFCDAIGTDVDRHVRSAPANRSLHERFNPMASRFRDQLFTSVHDNLFQRFLGEVLGEYAYKDYRGSTMLTLAQRRMILADHREANVRLKEEYFPELGDRPTFPPPQPADVHVSDEPPMDRATELLYLGMFKLWKQQDQGPRPEPPVNTPTQVNGSAV